MLIAFIGDRVRFIITLAIQRSLWKSIYTKHLLMELLLLFMDINNIQLTYINYLKRLDCFTMWCNEIITIINSTIKLLLII